MRTASKSYKSILPAVFGMLITIFIAFQADARPTFTQVDVASTPWVLRFIDHDYNLATNETTIVYEIQVTGAPALSHVVFELPVCSQFVSATPSDAIELMTKPDPTTGLPGLKFDGGQAERTTARYSIKLLGEYVMGNMAYSVKGATIYAIDTVYGPVACKVPPTDTYSITGTLFNDVNKQGILDSGEPLIPHVTLALYDAYNNLLATTQTDANGQYTFTGLDNGSYIVRVSQTTSADDFNEVLYAYFDATTRVSLNIIVSNGDSDRNNFGFAPDTVAILNDLNSDDPDRDGFTFDGTGKTIGFWKHQNKVAITGKGNAQIDKVTMATYLVRIESLYLYEPFQFGTVNKYQAAFDIMSSTSSDAVLLLKKQLLGTEFNEVGGLGLTGNYEDLQDALIAWGEYLAANSWMFYRDQLLSAKDIFDGINNTGE